jgi:hypothetical protein
MNCVVYWPMALTILHSETLGASGEGVKVNSDIRRIGGEMPAGGGPSASAIWPHRSLVADRVVFRAKGLIGGDIGK